MGQASRWCSRGHTGHTGRVIQAAYSPDGQFIVTATHDGTARWRADGRGEPLVLTGHTGSVTQAAYSPDGQYVVTTSGKFLGSDHTARVWRADGTGQPVVLTGHRGPVKQAAYSPDGQFIVTASNDETARVVAGGWGG